MTPEKNTNFNEVQSNDTIHTANASKKKRPSYHDAFIFKSQDEIQTKFPKENEDIVDNMYETPQSKSGSAKKRKVIELTKDDDAGNLTHFITYVIDLILIISQNRMKVIQKPQYPHTHQTMKKKMMKTMKKMMKTMMKKIKEKIKKRMKKSRF